MRRSELANSAQFADVLKKGLKSKDTQVVAADLLVFVQHRGREPGNQKADLPTRNPASKKFFTGADSSVRKAVIGQPPSTNPEVMDRWSNNLRVRGDSESYELLKDATQSKDALLRGMAKVAMADRAVRIEGRSIKPDLTKQN